MNRIVVIGLMTLVSSFVMGCATHRNPYANTDLSVEHWQQEVDRDASSWTSGADSWFLTGDANSTELENRQAPYSEAISTVMVKVPDDFTHIRVSGAFQVQIYGTDEANSVHLYGPNAGMREVAVNVYGDTLDLRQTEDASPDIRNVIVRIGIRNLTELNQTNCLIVGCGLIEGIRLNSHDLVVRAAGKGNMYLSGNLNNVRRIVQTGPGTLMLMGVNTSDMAVISNITNGKGAINLGGRNVGVTSITHHGNGDVNILGATSNHLRIISDGRGTIGISGQRINLNQVNAKDKAQVYVIGVGTPCIKVKTSGKSVVGLSGYANTGYLTAMNSSIIFAKSLGLDDGYIRTSGNAHINVSVRHRLFASADGNSSIYYYGQPESLARFATGSGVIIPIWTNVSYSSHSSSRYKDAGGFFPHE